jgi:hypothetical protein
MRQVVVDQLSREEEKKALKYLERKARPGPVAGIFWLPLPSELWSEDQQAHAACGPFYFAVEIQENAISFELLVRSHSTLHCSCIGYATGPQRDFLLRFIDQWVAEEKIRA